MSRVYLPNGQSMFNPLREYPRNMPCPCASGKKFKRCCLPTTPALVRKGKGKDELAATLHQIKLDYKAKRKADR